jgi:hypothetical protein
VVGKALYNSFYLSVCMRHAAMVPRKIEVFCKILL